MQVGYARVSTQDQDLTIQRERLAFCEKLFADKASGTDAHRPQLHACLDYVREGDTLVIDSVGFKDEKIWIDEYANPMSDALHVVERWTRPDAEHIHVETLIDDRKFYTKSFTYSRTWITGEPDDQVREFSCSENNVDEQHLGFGPGPVRKDGTIGYEDPAPLPPPIPRSPAPKE